MSQSAIERGNTIKSHNSHPMIGSTWSTTHSTQSPPKTSVDCMAWNLTNLLFFSITRNTIPVMNPPK